MLGSGGFAFEALDEYNSLRTPNTLVSADMPRSKKKSAKQMGTTEILIILAMLALNSLFAGYELALATVSLGRLQLLMTQQRRGASAAFWMQGRTEASLAVVQVEITLAGAVAPATGGAGAKGLVSPWLQQGVGISSDAGGFLAVALVVLPLAAVTIVAGELVPKALALKNCERVCLRLSPPMRILAYCSTRPSWLSSGLPGASLRSWRRDGPDAGRSVDRQRRL